MGTSAKETDFPRDLSSKQREPNPNNNFLIRKQRCKRRTKSLTCRGLFLIKETSLRVRVTLFASHIGPLGCCAELCVIQTFAK